MNQKNTKLAPSVLLLGAGYTLNRVRHYLPVETLLHASRSVLREATANWVEVDASKPESLKRVFAEYPSIKIVVDSIPPLRSESIKETTRIVEVICKECESHAIERLIYLSTTGVYGNQDGAWVDETTVCQPQHAWGMARVLSEQIYAGASFASTSLRIPAIYGPGRGIGNSIRNGSYRLLAEDRWSNRIHVEDLANCIAHIIRLSATELPKVFCIADDTPTLSRDVVDYYCKTFKLTPPATIANEQARNAGMITQLSNQRVSNALVKKVLGLSLKYPSFREGASTEFTELESN